MVKKLGLNAAFAVGTDLSGLRYDAYMAYNFVIEIDGLLTGNFSEVTGLESILIKVQQRAKFSSKMARLCY